MHLTIEISNGVNEESIGYYKNFWKSYISHDRRQTVVEYITEGFED